MTVSFAIPAAVLLSQCTGGGGWRWPSSLRANHNTLPSLILKNSAPSSASAAEAELGALFLNIKEGKVLQLALRELGHRQPPTPVHCDNSTAAGIANDTVEKQQSRSMEIQIFLVTDQVLNKEFDVQWHSGKENLADYFTKHVDAAHHQHVRP